MGGSDPASAPTLNQGVFLGVKHFRTFPSDAKIQTAFRREGLLSYSYFISFGKGSNERRFLLLGGKDEAIGPNLAIFLKNSLERAGKDCYFGNNKIPL